MYPIIDYQFLQWSADSESMLIYYSFDDEAGDLHSGYFWFNTKNGLLYSPFEMGME